MNDELVIKGLIARYEQNRKIAEQLSCLFKGDSDSPVLEAIWGTFNELSDMVAEKLGDHDGWIDWFIWENDCGAKSFSASGRAIRTVNDLLWAIRGVEGKI